MVSISASMVNCDRYEPHRRLSQPARLGDGDYVVDARSCGCSPQLCFAGIRGDDCTHVRAKSDGRLAIARTAIPRAHARR